MPLTVILLSQNDHLRFYRINLRHSLNHLLDSGHFILVAQLYLIGLGLPYFVPSLHQMMFQVVHNKVNSDSVCLSQNIMLASWHYNVSILHRWLNKLLERRFYKAMVRLQDTLDRPTTFHYVAL